MKFYLHFISPLLPHYWCRVAALLSQTSRDHRCGRVTWQVLPPCWSSRLAGAHERHAFGPPLWSSCQAGTRKAEGSVALPSGVQQRCPRAPTPEPGKGRRPKNRHSSKAKRVSALVSCLLPVLACLCRGFPGSGSLVLRPCPFGFLFVFVPPDVSFYWPRASRSSSRREGRRVRRRGTDPRTGTGRRPKDRLFQVPSITTFLRTSLCLTCSFPCTLLFIFRVCFGHCSGYLRHRQFHTQWYMTSPQVLSGFCRSPGEAQAALDGGRRSPFTLQGYRATCVSLVVLVKALVKLWISRGVIDLCRSLVFYTGFSLLDG